MERVSSDQTGDFLWLMNRVLDAGEMSVLPFADRIRIILTYNFLQDSLEVCLFLKRFSILWGLIYLKLDNNNKFT